MPTLAERLLALSQPELPAEPDDEQEQPEEDLPLAERLLSLAPKPAPPAEPEPPAPPRPSLGERLLSLAGSVPGAVAEAAGRASLGPLTAGGPEGLKQLGRGVARGAGNVMEAGSMLAGSVAEKLGEAGQEGFPVARPLFEGLAETARIPSEMMARSSEELASIADRLTPPEERRGYLERLKEDPGKAPEVVQQAIFENLPQLLTAGAALKAAPAAGTGFMWLQEAGDAHRSMIEAGADEEKASLGASLVGAVNAALEKAPLGRLLRKLEVPAGALQRAKDMLVQGVFEGGTEYVQGVTQALGEDLTAEGEVALGSALASGGDDAFAGALLGMLAGGAVGGATAPRKQATKPAAAPLPAEPTPELPAQPEAAAEPAAAAGETIEQLQAALTDTQAGLAAGALSPDEATSRLVGLGRTEARLTDKPLAEMAEATEGVTAGEPFTVVIQPDKTAIPTREPATKAERDFLSRADLAAAVGSMKVGAVLRMLAAPDAEAAAFAAAQPPAFAPGEAGQVGAAPAPAPAVTFNEAEVERRFTEAMQGVPRESPLRRLGHVAKEWGHAIARPYKDLPQTGEFAVAHEALRSVEVYPSVAIDEVARQLKEPIGALSPENFDLFIRKTALDDLAQLVEAERMREDLPFGLTRESLPAEREKVDAAVSTAPAVEQAVAASRELYSRARERLRAARESIGLPTDFLDSRGDAYLHHQVLEYADLRSRGPGGKLKAPVGRGYERRLTGSDLDYNLAYFEAQGAVMAQMLADANTAEQLAKISKQSIHEKLQAEARRQAKATGEKVNWLDLIPEGHAAWQPRAGNVFFLGTTVPEMLAQKLVEEGFSADDLKSFRQALVMGGPRTTLVLPEPLVKTLIEEGKAVQQKAILAASVSVLERVTKGWKVFQLIGPHRIVKYLSRNLVGDAQKVFEGNPRAFKEVPGAVRELSDYFRRNRVNDTLLGWLNLGGSAGGFYAQELGQTEKAKLRALRRAADGFASRLKRVGSSPAAATKAYFDTARGIGRFSESILRYAVYKDYLAEIRANGKPHNYAASIPEQIDALPTAEEKAYWLSNQLINAYDQVSALGKELRQHGLLGVLPPIPFWSFAEQNVRSRQRLLRNALRDDKLAAAMARRALGTVAVKSPMLVLKAGKFAALAYAFEAAMRAWNMLYSDEERELSEDERRRPHLILGFPGLVSPRDSSGRVRYFNRLSVFADAREWFGIDEFGYAVMDYLDGRLSISQVAEEIVKGPAAKLYNAFSPISPKGVFEVAAKFEGFPSVFEPRSVDSRVEQVFDLWGLGKEYRALTDQPLSSGGETRLGRLARLAPSYAFYYAEPGVGQYYDTLSRARQFMAKVDPAGERPPSLYRLSARSQALLNAKRALRHGSYDLARDYLRSYLLKQEEGGMGGTVEGLESSLKSMHPLADVPKKLQPVFIEWLEPEEREDLAAAIRYYQDVVASVPAVPPEEGR